MSRHQEVSGREKPSSASMLSSAEASSGTSHRFWVSSPIIISAFRCVFYFKPGTSSSNSVHVLLWMILPKYHPWNSWDTKHPLGSKPSRVNPTQDSHSVSVGWKNIWRATPSCQQTQVTKLHSRCFCSIYSGENGCSLQRTEAVWDLAILDALIAHFRTAEKCVETHTKAHAETHQHKFTPVYPFTFSFAALEWLQISRIVNSRYWGRAL